MQREKSTFSQNAICSIKPLFIALFPKLASSASRGTAMEKFLEMSLRMRTCINNTHKLPTKSTILSQCILTVFGQKLKSRLDVYIKINFHPILSLIIGFFTHFWAINGTIDFMITFWPWQIMMSQLPFTQFKSIIIIWFIGACNKQRNNVVNLSGSGKHYRQERRHCEAISRRGKFDFQYIWFFDIWFLVHLIFDRVVDYQGRSEWVREPD